MSGNVSIAIKRLVRDPALQCRSRISDDVVAEYAEAMKAGTRFPPVSVVREGETGVPLLVDGWHRAAAAELAGETHLLAEVTLGNRRDAIRAAVSANAAHGLQRTHEDKRRAVRVLLQDAEWCGESNRDLAELAGVSHAFVGQVRKHYGTPKGEALTAQRIEDLDGDLPPAWQAVLETMPWGGGEALIQKARRAQTVLELAKAAGNPAHSTGEGGWNAAARQRLEELAIDPWPWDEDKTTKRRADRAVALDRVADLEAALSSRGLPWSLRRGLWEAYRFALVVKRLNRWALSRAIDRFQGRPALLELAEARLEAERAKDVDAPWQQATAILHRAASDDLPGALEGIAGADDRVLDQLLLRAGADHWPAEVPAALRARFSASVDCPDPLCGGWSPVRDGPSNCIRCHRDHESAEQAVARTLERASDLILAGKTLQIGDVAIDRELVELLARDPGRLAPSSSAPAEATA